MHWIKRRFFPSPILECYPSIAALWTPSGVPAFLSKIEWEKCKTNMAQRLREPLSFHLPGPPVSVPPVTPSGRGAVPPSFPSICIGSSCSSILSAWLLLWLHLKQKDLFSCWGKTNLGRSLLMEIGSYEKLFWPLV